MPGDIVSTMLTPCFIFIYSFFLYLLLKVFGSGTSYFGATLLTYVQNHTIPESRVDDMATRILAAFYLLHQDSSDFPKVNFDAFNPDNQETNEHIDVQDLGGDHSELVREMGRESVVLLKNKGGVLPFGERWGGCSDWDGGMSEKRKTPRSLVLVGSDAGPGRIAPNGFADQGGVDGVLAMGWGSG
jgi:beta-glucosidase-like glycosyl hydrolase